MKSTERPALRIVMIGAGAMGAMFGARFARAGEDVVLYDLDAAHVAAITANGLRVSTPTGEIHLRLPATTAAEAIGPVDLAVILVDSNATKAAAGTAARILSPDGFALTLQNGIGNVETLAAALGQPRVVAGTTYNSAAKLAPGRVLHSNVGETTIGEIDGRPSARIEALAGLFRRAGLPIATSDKVIGHIWMKFVLNAAINPVSAITGLRPGEIARSEPARRLLERVLDEILAVVAAKGIDLPEADPRAAVLDHAWERYNRPSMLQHVEQGRQTEIDSLNGVLLVEARALRVACPFNEAVVLAVKAIEARAALRRTAGALNEAALEAAARATPRVRR
jgi:2-dehydropantoate 2-reductase